MDNQVSDMRRAIELQRPPEARSSLRRALVPGRFGIISLIVILILGGLAGCTGAPAQPAVVAPSETAAPATATATATAIPDTATPTAVPPTATPDPTVTPTYAPTATSLPDGMMFTDDFSSKEASSKNGWGMSSGGSVEYDWSGQHVVVAVKKPRYIVWNTPADFYVDFAAELEAQAVDKGYAEYGIIFRTQNSDTSSFYNFGVNTDGEYFLSKEIDSVWANRNPVSFTTSKYVKRGSDKNKLGVVAKGSQISLYINGFLVKVLTDDSLNRGKAGVFVATSDGDRNKVTFNRFTIYSVAKAQAAWGTTLAADANPPSTPRPLATKAPAAPTEAPAAPTQAAPATGTSVTVHNTFDLSCLIVFWGPADVKIDVGHDQSVTRAINPGTYGWRAFIGGAQTGEAGNLDIFAGATCNFTCDKEQLAIRYGCH